MNSIFRRPGQGLATTIVQTGNSAPENANAAFLISTLSIQGPGFLAPATYTITSDPSGLFEIINGNEIRLKAGAVLDYEAVTSYAVAVQAIDANLTLYTTNISIFVTNINEAPTAITIASGSLSVPDNTVAGTTIVTLATVDPDAGDTFTYSQITLSSDFETTAAGAIKVKTGAALAAGSYPITVRSTDSGGLVFDTAFTVNVTATASFLPTDLTVMPEWYKGDTGVTLGTGVQNWADQGTNGNDLAQLTGNLQPAHNAAGGFLSFDGVNDYMSVPAAMSGTDVHVFVVAALDTTNTAYERFVSHQFSNSDYQHSDRPILLEASSTFGDTKVQISFDFLTKEAQSAAGAIDNTTKLIHSSVVAGVCSVSINSVAGGTTAAITTPLTGTDLVVGSGYTTSYGKMDLYELIYVRGPMSAQEIINTENYLITRHGL